MYLEVEKRTKGGQNMKYTIYAITVGAVKTYHYALSTNEEWWGEEKVDTANTVKEAETKIKKLGYVAFA